MKRLSILLISASILMAVFFARVRVDWTQASAAGKQHWTEKSASDLDKSKGTQIDAGALNKVFVDLAKQLSPAVVNIYTKTKVGGARNQFGGGPQGGMNPDDLFRFFFGNPFGGGFGGPPPQRQAESLGSGFVINSDGVIVTNSHVVRMNGHNADSIRVKFKDDPPRSEGHEATVLGVDEGTDVAVIKLKKSKNVTVAPLGDSEKIQVGEWVVAIGNPYGHSHSVTKGIVSALGRNLEESRADFIQTDARINPGNSGGPLFNVYGEVIGINTAIDARAQGIGFAIPINTAKASIQQIIDTGSVALGWLGVEMSELTPQIASSLGLKSPDGALIQNVIPGEPADKAGIKSYDVIVEINGKTITTPRELMITVGNLRVGKAVPIKVFRDGKVITLSVTPTKRKSEAELAQREQTPQGQSGKASAKLGFSLVELSPEIRRQLGLDPSVNGGVIHRIIPGGPAEQAGLAPGDVITEVNRKPVRNVKEAEAAFATSPKNCLLRVQRRTASIIVYLDASEWQADKTNKEP